MKPTLINFLTELYKGCTGYLELRAIANSIKSKFYELESLCIDMEEIKTLNETYNIYFGVCPRTSPNTGVRESIKEVPAIFILIRRLFSSVRLPKASLLTC